MCSQRALAYDWHSKLVQVKCFQRPVFDSCFNLRGVSLLLHDCGTSGIRCPSRMTISSLNYNYVDLSILNTSHSLLRLPPIIISTCKPSVTLFQMFH